MSGYMQTCRPIHVNLHCYVVTLFSSFITFPFNFVSADAPGHLRTWFYAVSIGMWRWIWKTIFGEAFGGGLPQKTNPVSILWSADDSRERAGALGSLREVSDPLPEQLQEEGGAPRTGEWVTWSHVARSRQWIAFLEYFDCFAALSELGKEPKFMYLKSAEFRARKAQNWQFARSQEWRKFCDLHSHWDKISKAVIEAVDIDLS